MYKNHMNHKKRKWNVLYVLVLSALFALSINLSVYADEIEESSNRFETTFAMTTNSLCDETVEVDFEEEFVTGEYLPDDNVLLEGYIDELTTQKNPVLKNDDIITERYCLRKNTLGEHDQKIYNAISWLVKQTAAGDTDATSVFINVSKYLEKTQFTLDELGGDPTQSVINSLLLQKISDYNKNIIFSNITAEHPYELYWFDKTRGMGFKAKLSYSKKTINDVVTYTLTDKCGITITCYVSSDYSVSGDSGTSFIDVNKTKAASETVSNAVTIVNNAANLANDYDKLMFYRNAICNLVEYDYGVMNTGRAYGDPWQLINVFDNDPSTNVVCEGYSKAFKYLCDLTVFNNKSIEAYLVTGNLNEDAHMWNIVRMDNGKYYLVDITNSDECPEKTMFLVGGQLLDDNDPYFGYHVSSVGLSLDYVYDDNTKSIFNEELLIDDMTYLESIEENPVIVHVNDISIEDVLDTLTIGKSVQLSVSIFPQNATDTSVVWKSSNEKIATVSDKGLVTGKSSGTVTISVISVDREMSDTCTITVTESVTPTPTPVPTTPTPAPQPTPAPTPAPQTIEPTDIKLNRSKISIVKGSVFKLKANVYPSNATNKKIKWKSSNKKVAVIDKNGKVTGKKKGVAVIMAITNNGKSSTCKVTVKNPVRAKSVRLNKSKVTIKAGKTFRLKATIKPKNATNKKVTWSSKNKKIAIVDKDGNVKGLKKGVTTIVVTTKEGRKKAKCKVIVK